MKQMSVFSDQGPAAGLMQEFEQSFNKAVLEFSGDMSRFDVSLGISNEGRAAFNTAMPGFLDRINSMVQQGEMSGEIAHNFMLKEFEKIDMSKIASAAAEDGSPLQLIQALQSSGILIQKNFGEFTKLAENQYNAAVAKTKDKLAESGKTTVAMNDMAKMFLTAQEFITLPMQKFGDILETVTSFIKEKTTSASETQQNLFSTILNSDETQQVISESDMTKLGDGSSTSTTEVIPQGVPVVKKPTLLELENRLTDLNSQYKINNNISPAMGARAKVQRKLALEIEKITQEIELLKKMNAAQEKIAAEKDKKEFLEEAKKRQAFL